MDAQRACRGLETQQISTQLSPRDPQDTLNYRQLLQVCGSATNAFLNLARSAGRESRRRLLLLAPDRTAKHVVAELNLDGRWVIVDPTYRMFLKDAHGNLLTRKDLQNPEIFREATGAMPGYLPEYYIRAIRAREAGGRSFHWCEAPALCRSSCFRGGTRTWNGACCWSAARSCICFFRCCSLIVLMLVRVILGWLRGSSFEDSQVSFAGSSEPRDCGFFYDSGDQIARVRNLRLRLRFQFALKRKTACATWLRRWPPRAGRRRLSGRMIHARPGRRWGCAG